MIDCRNCVNWVDEILQKIEVDSTTQPHIFMGCRIFGNLDGNYQLKSCKHYIESVNLFIICNTCNVTVPKVCVSLGECINCTNTDLYCIDSCQVGKNQKFCTHFVRLNTEGIHLIDQDQVFDLFPSKPKPGKRKNMRSDQIQDISHIRKSGNKEP